VLITGPSGSGKSTTLAAMIEFINKTRAVHIVTIEDPIEYVFTSKSSLIRQRELGRDTLSFDEALKSAVRQDPNIIFIGEMRDLDTMQAALTLAETGHLVLSTLHTQDAIHSINRIVDVFPLAHQHEIRTRLSLVLQGVVVQQLIPKIDKNGRVLACEILDCLPSVRNLIRDNDLPQVRYFIQTGRRQGMKTMNQSLLDLYKQGVISWDEAYLRSNDREELLRLMPDQL
jgi:twitching motility protein PilT